MAGWVKTLQSQQVQLGVRVVSDLVDHLEGGGSEGTTVSSATRKRMGESSEEIIVKTDVILTT